VDGEDGRPNVFPPEQAGRRARGQSARARAGAKLPMVGPATVTNCTSRRRSTTSPLPASKPPSPILEGVPTEDQADLADYSRQAGSRGTIEPAHRRVERLMRSSRPSSTPLCKPAWGSRPAIDVPRLAPAHGSKSKRVAGTFSTAKRAHTPLLLIRAGRATSQQRSRWKALTRTLTPLPPSHKSISADPIACRRTLFALIIM
jgi:hypothetical protein